MEKQLSIIPLLISGFLLLFLVLRFKNMKLRLLHLAFPKRIKSSSLFKFGANAEFFSMTKEEKKWYQSIFFYDFEKVKHLKEYNSRKLKTISALLVGSLVLLPIMLFIVIIF
jgi:hypothetical protein